MIALGNDWNSLLWLVVLFFVILPALKRRRPFGPGGERWQEKVGEWKERGEQRRDEERAFRDQLLSEMRRHNAVAEVQNALLAEAIERMNGMTDSRTVEEIRIIETDEPSGDAKAARPRRAKPDISPEI